MSGFVQEFGFVYGGAVESVFTYAYPTAIPVGDSLVVAACSLSGLDPIATVSATDTKGNSWQTVITDQIGTTTCSVHMLCVTVTHAVTPADTITFTFSDYATRLAIGCAQFNDVLTPDVNATGDNGGNSWTTLVTASTAQTAQAEELLFGAWGLINASRVFTATNGFTGLTKYTSNGGSGERAVVGQYKYVSSMGTYTANGTLSSSGSAGGIVQTFRVSATPPGRSGRPKVWSGTAWVGHDAKVWDGAAWTVQPAKGYTGTDWVDSK